MLADVGSRIPQGGLLALGFRISPEVSSASVQLSACDRGFALHYYDDMAILLGVTSP